jgi:hypothetical protein
MGELQLLRHSCRCCFWNKKLRNLRFFLEASRFSSSLPVVANERRERINAFKVSQLILTGQSYFV